MSGRLTNRICFASGPSVILIAFFITPPNTLLHLRITFLPAASPHGIYVDSMKISLNGAPCSIAAGKIHLKSTVIRLAYNLI